MEAALKAGLIATKFGLEGDHIDKGWQGLAMEQKAQ